jgi:hypothetical protein
MEQYNLLKAEGTSRDQEETLLPNPCPSTATNELLATGSYDWSK